MFEKITPEQAGLSSDNVAQFVERLQEIGASTHQLIMMKDGKIVLELSGEQTGSEGCLSVPGKAGQVTRANYAKVKALDEDMNEFIIEGEELMARALQHEIDHLDGHLYVEKVEGQLYDTAAEAE